MIMFSKLIWQTDRMLYEDLIFRLEQVPSDNWYGQAFFRLFKRKRIVDKYQEFFLRHEDFHPKNIFELGIFDGGSIAFWFELFKPNKHIAIDYLDRQDSRYFEEYIQSRGLTDKIKTYWKTNQSDKDNLRKIVSTEFTDPLDLVIDDASHMYLPTRASFETLFPLVKPRGLYIIEDWAWGHWPAYIADEHPWSKIESPTNLITKIIEAAGTSVSLITNITITKGFVVVERGEEIIPDPTSFDIDNYIIKRPNII